MPIICQDNNNKRFVNIFKKNRIIKKIVDCRSSENIEKTHSFSIDNIGCTNTIKNVA